MVFVLGLDRHDGTPIATMPDHLWTQHSAEIKHRFEAQQQHDARMSHRKTANCCALGFTDFCKTFATVGGNTTQAMQDHAAATSTAPPPTAVPPTPVPGSTVIVMPDDGSNVVLYPPGAPKPTQTPVVAHHWHQPPRAKPKIKKAHGQGMSKGERKDLLANRMRKANVAGVGHGYGGGGQQGLVRGKGGLGPAWTRCEIEPPTEEKNMGSWTALVYCAEQQERLGVDESGKPVAPGTICPNSMNGLHCYTSRANVFKCMQCGAKK